MKYFTTAQETELLKNVKEIGRMIGTMMLKYESFCRKKDN